MEHFLYVIQEKEGSSEICSPEIINNLYMNDVNDQVSHSSEQAAIELDYDLNNTVPSLNKIMEYYNIPTRIEKKELRKNNKIKRIVEFELNCDNEEIVKKRKRYWEYITELKEDNYFKKHIIIDL